MPYGRINDGEGGPPMGRGRSKAKETKVARSLKYINHEIDIEKLAQELQKDKSNEDCDDEIKEYPDKTVR